MSELAGTGSLLRLALRQDRARLVVWTVVAAGSLLATASAMRELYGNDPAGLAQFGRSIAANTSLAVLYGPLTAMGSIGALAAWRSGTTTMVLVALFSMFTVVRHTRADEEAGRLELIGATPVGRRAPLAAALILVAAADAVIGVLIAAGMVGLGEPFAGSVSAGGRHHARRVVLRRDRRADRADRQHRPGGQRHGRRRAGCGVPRARRG